MLYTIRNNGFVFKINEMIIVSFFKRMMYRIILSYKGWNQMISSGKKKEYKQSKIISDLIFRRKELGLTQRSLAKRANLHQTAIARLEKEGAIPRLDTLEKVAEALELKLIVIEKTDDEK